MGGPLVCAAEQRCRAGQSTAPVTTRILPSGVHRSAQSCDSVEAHRDNKIGEFVWSAKGKLSHDHEDWHLGVFHHFKKLRLGLNDDTRQVEQTTRKTKRSLGLRPPDIHFYQDHCHPTC